MEQHICKPTLYFNVLYTIHLTHWYTYIPIVNDNEVFHFIHLPLLVQCTSIEI